MATNPKSIRSPSPTGSVRSSAPSRPTPSTTVSRPQTSVTVHDEKKDAVKVDLFYGDRAKLSAFLIQLKLVYKLNPIKYEQDEDKVMFAALHLKGPAFAWFEPTLKDWVGEGPPEDDTERCFAKFADFEHRIKKIFGTAEEGRAAARVIYHIRQKGSAAAYFSEFDQVASKLNWEDENAFAEIFYNGLKKTVR